MKNRSDGGFSVVNWLKNAGVENVFSVSGGVLNPIYHACSILGLPLVHTRHEAAACFMAEAASRVSGKLGVAAVTLGPGVTNTVTSALVARMAGTPLLIIGAQSSTQSFERGAGMAWETLPILEGVTKWSAHVLDAERIPEYLDIAWRKIWSGRPGPVYLELPANVLSANVEDASVSRAPIRRPDSVARISTDMAGRLEGALANARRPLLILGDEMYWTLSDDLVATIEKHNLPFTTMRLARGAVDENHPFWAGPAYVPCNENFTRCLKEADCIILLGHHFEFDLAFGDGVNPKAVIVQIASEAELLGKNRRADLAIQATPASAVPVIAEAPQMQIDAGWTEKAIKGWSEERAEQLDSSTDGDLHPVAVVDTVCKAMPEDTIFVTSHGNVDFWADARLRIRKPGTYLRAGQSGALGAEVPYGLGARFANPQVPVVVFVGDGGVGYHVSEIDTSERYDRPFIIVVMDDEQWSAIALPQEKTYQETYEMKLPRRDWARVAEGLGGGGALARTPEELTKALDQAMAAGKPWIIQVPVRSVLSPYMEFITR
jgi:acetolactate synthase I/II/III large subunit